VTLPHGQGPPRAATLDDLAALNREMAALIQAGLPLEESLGRIAADFGHGPGRLAERLERETAAGKSLAEAIAAQGDALPLAYRAVVEAGLKSGRLAAALEGFAESAARLADLRRITAQALAYPLMVVVLAVVMVVVVAAAVVPAFQALELETAVWVEPLAVSRSTATLWLVAAPIAAAVGAWLWWRGSARPADGAVQGSTRRQWTRWIPGAARATRLGGQASFAEMLGLLVECRVPLVEALPLAAKASGDAGLQAAATELSGELAAGAPLSSQAASVRRLPPLVRTALLASPSERALVTALRQAAEAYRERTAESVARMSVLIPLTATIVVGVLVTGAYALLLFQPYLAVLRDAATWGL
jgi:type II secretory pathway component PulF